MRYLLCVVIGIGLTVAAVALVTSGVFAVAQVGTCASGGPYVIANQCPDGMGLDIMKLIGGIVLVLVGVGVFGARGRPGGAGGAVNPASGEPLSAVPRAGRSAGLAVAAWGMLWIGISAAIWYAANGDNAPPDRNGAVTTTLTIVFGAMGAVPLLALLVGMVVGLRTTTAVPVIGVGTAADPGAAGAEVNLADLVRHAQEIARQQRAEGGPVMSAGDADDASPKPPPTPGT